MGQSVLNHRQFHPGIIIDLYVAGNPETDGMWANQESVKDSNCVGSMIDREGDDLERAAGERDPR